MFFRLAAAALAVASTLSLSSCLDYDEELTVHEDLSGEAHITLTLPDTLIGKYEALGSALDQANLAKRFDEMRGVKLAGYESSGGRKPVIKLHITFSSLENLNDAIAANKPAGIFGGQFTIKKEGGTTRIERKLGVGEPGMEVPEFNYANYKTHYDGKILGTNSPQYNSHGRDIRYRYTLAKMLAEQPSQNTTLKKSLPWKLILICLVAVGGSAWYGWKILGNKKGPGSAQRPHGPADALDSSTDAAPRRPGPPQPRRPGAPPQ